LWPQTDVVLGVGTRMLIQLRGWGHDKAIKMIRIDADPKEPDRLHPPAAALVGDSKAVLRRLLDILPAHNAKRPSRRTDMERRQAAWRIKFETLPQAAFVDAIRAELPEDGIFVDEVTQIGFAARFALPVYKPRTFLSPGYQDNLGWGYATALGAQDAMRDVQVVSISGDGGFMFTANEMATAIRHRIPLTAIVFADGAFGNVRRIQKDNFGNRLIASDLVNPDFVRFAESFGAAGERAKTPEALREALRRALKRRDQPTLIEVPVGPFPSPWPYLHLPRVRGL
jgi:acetolactate synthase-1/2/3 large subunit